MTDEEKKEYRDKLVEDCMKYNHIDYDDDKDIVETMVEAIASEELMELIPNFDRNNLTSRQKLLAFMSVKELYDNRDKYRSDTKTLSAAVSSMLLKEIYGGAAE
jgi:Ca2+-binding EF-hand superfamily protein